MIKLVCFVKRRPDLDPAAFHEHWSERHGPLIAGCPELARHVRRYEQNHRLGGDRGAGGREHRFDGVAVQWYDAMDDFLAFVREPAYRELIVPDEGRFLARDSLTLVFTEDAHVVIDGGTARSTAGVKLLCLVRRRADLDAEAFRSHWRRHHGPLVAGEPDCARHMIGYDQSPRLIADYARDDASSGGANGVIGFDGLAEQWFAAPEELSAFAAEPAYRERIRPDEERFLDRDALLPLVSAPPRLIIG